MIYIAICDDDEKTLDDLRQRVEILLRERQVIAAIYEYTQSRSLQYDINEGKYFDLILSDIEMPDVDRIPFLGLWILVNAEILKRMLCYVN